MTEREQNIRDMIRGAGGERDADALLAGLVLLERYRRKVASLTADEMAASPSWLGSLVRRGWLQSHKYRADIPRTYMLRDGGLMHLLLKDRR